MNFKKAMVTGGAGFIGSNLIGKLLEKGLKVISIDNYLSGKKENLYEYRDNTNFEEVNCDVTDYNKLKKHMEDVDIIFNNMASKKTICLKDPRRDLEINGTGTFNLLELARDYDIKKFVHASTGSVYGEAVLRPQNENHPLVPTSYYGVSKLAGEKYVKVFNHLYGLNTTVLRYFHVYGPKQDYSINGGVVAIFINKILRGLPITIYGDGSQQRSFTYVQDVINANIKVTENKKTKGEIYNCASGINITINELTELIFKIVGKKTLIKYGDWTIGDIKDFDIDNSKIRSLGFKFESDIKEGLSRTVGWMKNEMP